MASESTTPDLQQLLTNVVTDLRAAGDPEKVPKMEAYMKHHFTFLGVTSPVRKQLQKPLIKGSKGADPDAILAIAEACWKLDARELQYVGCELLRARAKVLEPEHLPRVRELLATKSWWDTIDGLAAHTVGTMVSRHPELGATMDEWIDDPNIWIARTAILHQLTYKDRLDEDRLFRYVRKRSGDKEFFIRKALGWALRDYARVAPDRVRAFVEEHADSLSGLTRREATKHL